MIVEKRRQVRKSYQNYSATPVEKSVLVVENKVKSEPKEQKEEHLLVSKLAYYPPHNFTDPADWEDDSVLTTQTTPRFVVYLFAAVTIFCFFVIGSTLLTG